MWCSLLLHFNLVFLSKDRKMHTANLVITDDGFLETTLYYCGDELIGRALSPDEYKLITADELRVAITHSIFASEFGLEEYRGMRMSPDSEPIFNAMTAKEIKRRLEKMSDDHVLLYTYEPRERLVWPTFSKGPRKGCRNFWKGEEPEMYFDRFYFIWRTDADTNSKKGKIDLDDDGQSFTVVEEETV
jgi:hypothetical protein